MAGRFSKLFRRRSRRSSGIPFAEMSREDQVAYMDNIRGADGRAGARDQAKFTGPHPGSDSSGAGGL